MSDVLPADVAAVVERGGTAPDPLLEEMAVHGRERSFPTLGPVAGRTLRLLARCVGARRAFEFGSGFGYSAAWLLGALPPDGEIVLTDYDEQNLETARSFLERHDAAATVHYEAGDALELFSSYDGPFDVVFLDHDKQRYVDALELVVDALGPGGLVVADNVLSGPVTPAGVRAALAGESVPDDAAQGVASYLERVRDDPAFETTVLPVGSGLAVSRFDP